MPGKKRVQQSRKHPAPDTSTTWLIPGIATLLYFPALMLWRESIPPGLGNDAAEEALRGVLLLQSRRFEPITFSIGNSAETLYLYLMGFMTRLFGTTMVAIQLLSVAFAVACIWLVCLLVRQIDRKLPLWIPIALTTSSVWLFHYGRAGLRTISAPVFLLGFILLVCIAEQKGRFRYLWSFAAGVVLGLSVYAYTSCRIIPLAAGVYMVFRVVAADDRTTLLRVYGSLLVGALLVSIPNIAFFIDSPREFLLRGDYVLARPEVSISWNLLATLLLPFHYLDRFRVSSALPIPDPSFDVDGFSSTLMAAGFNPINPIVSILIVVGVAKAWRLRKGTGGNALVLLMSTWLVGTVILGIAGPSLTRLLIMLPIYLIFAALAFSQPEANRKRRTHPLVFVLMLTLFANTIYSYFLQFRSSPETQFWFSRAATPMGVRALELAKEGRRVLCVVTKDINVIRYLTYPVSQSAEVAEFHDRPFLSAEISDALSRADIILVEKNPRFDDWFRSRYQLTRDATNEMPFDEFADGVPRSN